MRRLIVGLVVIASAACWSAPLFAETTQRPPCFGAASRNLAHPCVNPRLRLSVVPSPSEAQITPISPCSPIKESVHICAFGAPAAAAVRTFALVGDSHAGHWRAAIDPAAQALGWQGLSITRSSCPFMEATTELPEPRREQCTRWTQDVLHWFTEHPEVSTVIMSDHRAPVRVTAGKSLLATQLAGYLNVWRALPDSVKHILVIRDIPYAHENTLDCVQRAIVKREPADRKCALQRASALQPDPAAVAAERLRSPRVQVIDLTHFFCDVKLCYPVVGGALVYKNADHLTRVFGETLGPFMLDQIKTLMASWQS